MSTRTKFTSLSLGLLFLLCFSFPVSAQEAVVKSSNFKHDARKAKMLDGASAAPVSTAPKSNRSPKTKWRPKVEKCIGYKSEEASMASLEQQFSKANQALQSQLLSDSADESLVQDLRNKIDGLAAQMEAKTECND